MKKTGDQKTLANTLGSAGTRSLSKKELQEQRKKEEEEAAAHVFQEFVETFQEAPIKSSKVWIKAGTYDAGARREDNSERGKVYKPQSRLGDEKKSSAEQAQEFARMLASKDDRLGKRRGDKDKKKSNLEMFKEELRQIQEAREERHKYKGILRTAVPELEIPCYAKDEVPGSFDNGDPTTTNLYLGNLNPKVTEPQLKEIFGRYGPLASIKIMWPRSDEEKARQRNCGFVAFMSRKDGERALRCLNGKEVLSYEMKMGWGKAVTIPSAPIYIPPALQMPLQPPPPSGLPFNAQPPKHLAHKIPRLRTGEPFPTDPEDRKLFDQILSQSLVRVVIPTERSILVLIHRMVEFVIREGPMFEAMIMNRELNNPYFSFLFENQSPGHVYYRWKLYSLLQGDMPKAWSNRDFRMFKGGSVWRPPTMNVYTQGMPEELVEEDEIIKDNRGTLSKTQRERLEDLIRQLTPERGRVAEAMVFCVEHAEAADEIAVCVAEALSSPTTALRKKVARLYLVSDILHNCGVKLTNASYFRKAFQERLVDIMRAQHSACAALTSRLQSEGYRARVARVLLAWEDWAVYPKEFLVKLNNTFMGVEEKVEEEIPEPAVVGAALATDEGSASDGGGSDEEASSDGGGGPLDGAALRRLAAAAPNLPLLPLASANAAVLTPRLVQDDEIDGVPMVDEDIDGVPLDSSTPAPGFIPSKWEFVEPSQVEAQAVTTSQWERLEVPPDAPRISAGASPRSDTPTQEDRRSPTPTPSPPPRDDTSEVSESRRALLRAVEVKALRYQDELEGGRRALREGWTLAHQVQHHKRKLLKKMEREAKQKKLEEASKGDSTAWAGGEGEGEEEGRRSGSASSSVDTSSRHRRSDRRRNSSDGEDDDYKTSKKSKRSKEVSLSPPPTKRSRHRSRSTSRSRSSRSSRRRSPSPVVRESRSSLRDSRSSLRDSRSPSSSTERRREKETRCDKHTHVSRKHKHKHKY